MNFKRNYLLIFIFVFIFCHALNNSLHGSDIYIGVACPLSGDDRLCGDAMIKGINLYIDEINKNEIFFGEKIHLIVKDDKNDKYTALKVAKDFASDDRILLIIGHYFSSTSFAAGRIYRNVGIPAITASATANKVTNENEWYFRVIPDNSFQSYYIANYAKSHLKIKSVIILNDEDEYGTSLALYFEKTAKDLGIEIIKKIVFKSSEKNSSKNLNNIINEIIKMDDSSALFLAVHASDSLLIADAFKRKGKKIKILGADSLGTDTFIKQSLSSSNENKYINNYTDNIHYVTPFMHQITNKESLIFLNKYKKKYKTNPYWIAASYYDAICVAVNAIKKSNLSNNENIYSKRVKIKDNLKLFYSYNNSIKGVTGNIFFDENGNTEKPMIIGVFQNNKPVPSYAQYDLIPPHKIDDNTLEKTLNGQMIVINDKVMQKKNLVYAGINIISIDNINIKDFTFNAKFYLYFKFMEDFNDNDIIFNNSIAPISLSSPVLVTNQDFITTKKYLVQGKFYSPFDLKLFPFDKQKLKISFYHAKLTNNILIYVSDTKNFDKDFKNISVSGWKITNQITFQDIFENSIKSKIVESAKPEIYSQLKTLIEIKRDNLFYSLLQFIPLIIIVLIPYFMFIKIENYLNIFIPVSSIILILNSCYHYYVLKILEIQYIPIIEYLIFGCYFLIFLTIFFIIKIKNYIKNNSIKNIRIIKLTGITIYSIFLFLIAGFFYF